MDSVVHEENFHLMIQDVEDELRKQGIIGTNDYVVRTPHPHFEHQKVDQNAWKKFHQYYSGSLFFVGLINLSLCY
jgi:hypothetical protein